MRRRRGPVIAYDIVAISPDDRVILNPACDYVARGVDSDVHTVHEGEGSQIDAIYLLRRTPAVVAVASNPDRCVEPGIIRIETT